jgi:hypothetical protein
MNKEMRIFSIKVFLLMAVAALSGCGFQTIDEQELLGQYRADLPGEGTETLELLPKGECRQAISLINGVAYNARGTWKYNRDRKRLFLTGLRESLTPTGELNPHLADEPNQDVLATPVSRNLSGGITIMLNEDIDFQKQR